MTSDEYLEHYGRKGMKWGQHIFTNIKSNISKNPGLGRTALSDTGNAVRSVGSSIKSRSSSRQDKAMKKLDDDVKKMSDEELNKRTKRLNLENNYMNAVKNRASLAGRSKTESILDNVGEIAVTATSVLTLALTVSQLIKKND